MTDANPIQDAPAPTPEPDVTFVDLGLSDGVLRAVAEAGYTRPTPIQSQAIPVVLMGRDILGCAQTGTGKTASFTLPMIDILAAGRTKARMPRSLIIEPTRELAHQVAENFNKYGKHHRLRMALLIGGESFNDQIAVIDRGPDVLIATPGRLLDMFERGRLLMTDVKILVIDEADRMLDMGFIPDVERIVSLLSPIRQTLFFSATMPPEIRRLADAFLSNPKEITVAPPSTPAATVEQGLVVVSHNDGRATAGGQREKRAALRALIAREEITTALLFCNRKRDVGVLCRSLQRYGVDAEQLHGDMAQSARTETLDRFRAGGIKFLVCSDVAARGLDIPAVSHVFNFDVPSHAEDYVHRIGRTGRAGRSGKAFTLATAEDSKYLDAISRLIGREIPRVEVEGIESSDFGDVPPSERRPRGRGGSRDAARSESRGGRRGEARSESRNDNGSESQSDTRSESRNDNGGESRRSTPPPSRDREGRRGRGDRRRRDVDELPPAADGPVLGLGDHVPAFLLRPVPKLARSRTASPSDDDEDAADENGEE